MQAVAVDLRRERVPAPVGAAQRDGVDVTGEAQRRRVAGAGAARDEARATGLVLVRGDLEPGRLEAPGEHGGRPALVAGRVDRVEADELLRELDDGRGRHYFGSTCVATAPAARRAVRGRRRVVPVEPSAPRPVSARTYSSW